jgi:ubiquinone/menaquinone biosynthesis C-methylase UbiE
LDVVCSWGGKSIYLAEHSKLKTVTGFGIPNAYVPEVSKQFASKKNITNCFFKMCYAEDMSYNDNIFDVIIMEDVLEHVADPEKVMKECYRVLRPSGIIIAKFPSFLMMYAHHLDRAITFPGLHYILSMKTWAAGLNYLLLNPGQGLSYEPFSKVVATKYSKSITRDLNGLDFRGFREIMRNINFKQHFIGVTPFKSTAKKVKITRIVYNLAYEIVPFREFLSSFSLFVGEKVA